MCGICGVIFTDKDRPVDPEWLGKLSATLRHRGPDDDGMIILGNAGLAHRRLSIIDRAGGRQPILNEDGTLALVFNGEIYNHAALRDELLARGHRYRTRSDTETVLHAFEEYGEGCLERLRGMFAFALYDHARRRLFLARDRVGKKPVYYYRDTGVFLFASEVQALLASGLCRREVNTGALDFYLSLGYVPGRETLFKGIRKLEPGHYLVRDGDGSVTETEYWDLRHVPRREMPYREACARLREKLAESVRLRLMSEVPLGVFLSGGLDSSAIVGCMSALAARPVKTFSVGYADAPQTSELHYARIVADRFKTEHHEFYLTPAGLFDSIDEFLDHSGEPLVESAGIALLKLAQMAKPRATVLLSGEGADEILAGYPLYPRMRRMEVLHGLQRLVPGALLDRGIALAGGTEQARKYAGWIREPFTQRYRSLSFDLPASLKQVMYRPAFRKAADGPLEEYFVSLFRRVPGQTMLGQMLYIDTKSWLAEDILLKADRMTMAASVELRAPFLDHELMEFCYALPDRYKLKGARGKCILKDIMRGTLPDAVIDRPKRGFPVPLTAWFAGELQQKAKALLLSERALDRGYFEPAYLREIFDRINRGEDLGRRIFSLVTLERWHRKYIDGGGECS